MASKILSGTAAAVKKFFRADAGALAVAIPVFAAAVMAVVVSQTATDWPVVYGHFEWSVFGDSLAALALFWAALRFCSGWCAALAAVLAYAALVLRIFMLVLYRETYMRTDYSSIKLLWDHTDFYAIGAMLGRYCWLWLIPATLAALAVVGATAYAAWRRIGDLAPGRLRVWKRIAGALFLAAVAGNVLFLLAEAEGRVYTGHLARPLPVSAAYFVRDALGGGRRSPAVPLAAESRAILEAKGVIPPAGSPPAAARPARFDRIVIVAVESLDLAFIRAFNPGMPEGVTPNLDRLMTQYPSMTNFFCSSQPTSWGLTGLLMSRFDFDRELLEPEKRPSLFRVASKQGYVSCYFSPMVGIFAENRRTYGELFAPDRQFYLEDWHRKYGLWRDFAWGISDRELYSCVLNELRALKKQRFVALVSATYTCYQLAIALVRPEVLFTACAIVRYQAVCRLEDGVGRTVVLFQSYHLRLWEETFEIQNVLLAGAAPAVDGLVVITNGADVATTARQLHHQGELDFVRVLVLVYHNVLEMILIDLQKGGVGQPQFARVAEQVVVVHHVHAAQTFLIAPIDGGDAGCVWEIHLRHLFRCLHIGLCEADA